LAYHDIGTLTVRGDSLLFNGGAGDVEIWDIRKISYGKQGRDFINNWVRIEYANGLHAFFADGYNDGWGGIFGGTKKIYKAIKHLSKS